MAQIVFSNGKNANVSAEKGRAIWNVLTGKAEGDAAQQKFALTVKKIYLNWRNAPDDYLLQNKDIIAPMVMSNWMVTPQGKPTRPEPTDKDTIRVSRILGLTHHTKGFTE
jgi:hypothetical protein